MHLSLHSIVVFGLVVVPNLVVPAYASQPLLGFMGICTTNFSETITFCTNHPQPLQRNTWHIIPMIARAADSGQSEYNEKGALLYGGVYYAANGSVEWRGLGFSANGPYDATFALGPQGKMVSVMTELDLDFFTGGTITDDLGIEVVGCYTFLA